MSPYSIHFKLQLQLQQVSKDLNYAIQVIYIGKCIATDLHICFCLHKMPVFSLAYNLNGSLVIRQIDNTSPGGLLHQVGDVLICMLHCCTLKLLSCILFSGTVRPNQSSPDSMRRFDEIICDFMVEQGVPGAALSISLHGKPVYRQGLIIFFMVCIPFASLGDIAHS